MSSSPVEYPGTEQHQALLRAVVEQYADDPRIRCVAVFGSLGRGDWHPSSDLDLDAVIEDDIEVQAGEELRRLREASGAIGAQIALIVEYDSDSGDEVLESLMQPSVRYHPLADTKPAIESSWQVLGGRMSHEELVAAARANRRPGGPGGSERMINECLRYAVSAEAALQRGRVWIAIQELHQVRVFLMVLFQAARAGTRPLHTFDAEASPGLHELLSATLPAAATTDAARMGLVRTVGLLADHLGDFAGPGVMLSDGQRVVLERLRARLTVS